MKNIKKQNYWIFRQSDPWQVICFHTNKFIAEMPAHKYDMVDSIIFAPTEETVHRILDKIKKDNKNVG